jgi:hypothetical protein
MKKKLILISIATILATIGMVEAGDETSSAPNLVPDTDSPPPEITTSSLLAILGGRVVATLQDPGHPAMTD